MASGRTPCITAQVLVEFWVAATRSRDVRLAAVAGVHGVREILTLNPDDFRGLPGLSPVHPVQVG